MVSLFEIDMSQTSFEIDTWWSPQERPPHPPNTSIALNGRSNAGYAPTAKAKKHDWYQILDWMIQQEKLTKDITIISGLFFLTFDQQHCNLGSLNYPIQLWVWNYIVFKIGFKQFVRKWNQSYNDLFRKVSLLLRAPTLPRFPDCILGCSKIEILRNRSTYRYRCLGACEWWSIFRWHSRPSFLKSDSSWKSWEIKTFILWLTNQHLAVDFINILGKLFCRIDPKNTISRNLTKCDRICIACCFSPIKLHQSRYEKAIKCCWSWPSVGKHSMLHCLLQNILMNSSHTRNLAKLQFHPKIYGTETYVTKSCFSPFYLALRDR